MSLFTKPESITYIGWLKSDIIGPKSTSIEVEFNTPELANEVIRKGLNWDGQPHSVERYVTQNKIMQCFNCQSYGHIGNLCLSTTKYAKCADHHDTKSCTATHIAAVQPAKKYSTTLTKQQLQSSPPREGKDEESTPRGTYLLATENRHLNPPPPTNRTSDTYSLRLNFYPNLYQRRRQPIINRQVDR